MTSMIDSIPGIIGAGMAYSITKDLMKPKKRRKKRKTKKKKC